MRLGVVAAYAVLVLGVVAVLLVVRVLEGWDEDDRGDE